MAARFSFLDYQRPFLALHAMCIGTVSDWMNAYTAPSVSYTVAFAENTLRLNILII